MSFGFVSNLWKTTRAFTGKHTPKVTGAAKKVGAATKQAGKDAQLAVMADYRLVTTGGAGRKGVLKKYAKYGGAAVGGATIWDLMDER